MSMEICDLSKFILFEIRENGVQRWSEMPCPFYISKYYIGTYINRKRKIYALKLKEMFKMVVLLKICDNY